ncbi:MAG: hypothetical protein ACJAV4_000313, partial [Pontimonas sp.]
MGFFSLRLGGLDKGFITARHQEWSRLAMAQNTFEPNADSVASKKDAPRRDGFLSRLTGRSRQEAPEPQKAPSTPVTPPAKKTAPTPEKAAAIETPVKKPAAEKSAAVKAPAAKKLAATKAPTKPAVSAKAAAAKPAAKG